MGCRRPVRARGGVRHPFRRADHHDADHRRAGARRDGARLPRHGRGRRALRLVQRHRRALRRALRGRDHPRGDGGARRDRPRPHRRPDRAAPREHRRHGAAAAPAVDARGVVGHARHARPAPDRAVPRRRDRASSRRGGECALVEPDHLRQRRPEPRDGDRPRPRRRARGRRGLPGVGVQHDAGCRPARPPARRPRRGDGEAPRGGARLLRGRRVSTGASCRPSCVRACSRASTCMA